MAMTAVWTILVGAAVLCGAAGGQMEAVSGAALEGAGAAVELCLSMAGALCLWTGVMEVLRQSGALGGLRRLLQPVLGRLFPEFRHRREIMDSICANVSANLLGLGNAATPLGIQAVRLMAEESPGVASGAMCRFVVCNTASIQLIPTTVAAVRSAAGCNTPFDILPAVWFASAAALTVGLLAAWLLERVWKEG